MTQDLFCCVNRVEVIPSSMISEEEAQSSVSYPMCVVRTIAL